MVRPLPEPRYPFVPLDSVTLLYLHVQLPADVCGSFLLFESPIYCILSNADVYILYHVVLCIHSLPGWGILMLDGQ
jgi:hypothetical protein